MVGKIKLLKVSQIYQNKAMLFKQKQGMGGMLNEEAVLFLLGYVIHLIMTFHSLNLFLYEMKGFNYP